MCTSGSTREGYQPLITQLFYRDDPYIGRDAVFADVESLQADFVRHEPGVAPDGTTVEEPFVTLDWTFVLAARRRIAKGASQCHGYRSPAIDQQPEPIREFMARRGNLNVFRLLANAPHVFAGWTQMVDELFDSPTFSLRMREVIILRVAHLQGSRYELGQHTGIARAAGLTEQQINAHPRHRRPGRGRLQPHRTHRARRRHRVVQHPPTERTTPSRQPMPCSATRRSPSC